MTYSINITGHAGQGGYDQNTAEEAARSFDREHAAVQAALNAAIAVLKTHGLHVSSVSGSAMRGGLDVPPEIEATKTTGGWPPSKTVTIGRATAPVSLEAGSGRRDI